MEVVWFQMLKEDLADSLVVALWAKLQKPVLQGQKTSSRKIESM